MKLIDYRLLLLLFATTSLKAQLYQEKKSQHRFAQTYVGANALYVPSSGQVFWEGGQSAFPHLVIPRLTIGGLHFWGHVDFQVNFSLATLGSKRLDNKHEFRFETGADFTARVYPWAVRFNALRPYVGAGVNYMRFALVGSEQGTRSDLYPELVVMGGLSFAFKNWQLNAEANWTPFHQKEFYINHRETQTIALPPLAFSLGLVRYFDTTIKTEKGTEAGSYKILEERLKEAHKLSGFSVGIGGSSALFVSSPTFGSGARRSLPRHRINIHVDLGVGYLFHRANVHVGVSYRDYRSTVESYGLEHVLRRQSIAFEGYKFLLNYKGFVPFVGLSVSLDGWAMGEFQDDVQVGETRRTFLVSPGIIVGWDILASPVETWVLRTNLRYYPFQTITDIEGNAARVDQFEMNFIQAVFYPQRMFHVAKAKQQAKKEGMVF